MTWYYVESLDTPFLTWARTPEEAASIVALLAEYGEEACVTPFALW